MRLYGLFQINVRLDSLIRWFLKPRTKGARLITLTDDCRDSPRRARYFLPAREESTQRSVPRCPTSPGGSALRAPAGPGYVGLPSLRKARTGGFETRLRLKQRSRTSPPVPRSVQRRRGEWGVTHSAVVISENIVSPTPKDSNESSMGKDVPNFHASVSQRP